MSQAAAEDGREHGRADSQADRAIKPSARGWWMRSRSLRLSPYAAMAVAGLLTILAVLAVGLTISNLHARVEQETRDHLAQTAFLLSQESSRSFEAVDLVLKNSLEHLALQRLDHAQIAAHLGTPAVHELLVEQLPGIPQMDRLLLIGADGRLVNHSQVWPIPDISLADREQYVYMRDHETADLYISEPVRNRVDGSWAMQMARRLVDSDGRFVGIIGAAVKLDHFVELYRGVGLGDGGSIALMRKDGLVLARHPVSDDKIGRKGNVRSGAAGGGWSTGLDGVYRYVAWHEVPGVPLVITAAKTSDAVLGSWRRDAIILALGAAGGVGGILLLLVALLGKIRRMKRSEELLAVQNSEVAQQSRLLLDAQRVGRLGHWVANFDSADGVWSPQLFEIAGLPPAPLMPFARFVDIIHPDDVAGYMAVRRRAHQDGTRIVHEHRWIRPDGEVRWVRIEADPRFDAQGKLVGMFGIVQDITERKVAEEIADESRMRLVDAIESLSEGFLLFDRDDRFVMSNTRFREMFPAWVPIMTPGTSYEEILRQGHASGIIGPDGDELEAWLRQRMAWHLAGSKVREHREADGRWILSVDHRTTDGGVVGLRTDITAFKTVQAELEQKLAYVQAIRSDLEDQKRELEATGAELRTARDAAEAANRAKSDFLAIMSHEVRTPLSGMVGMVDLLRNTPLSDEQQRYTALAKESADLLLEVINDILDFSKLEAGRLGSECIDFDVRHLVDSAASVMGERARKRHLDLRVAMAPALSPFLKGDPTRIRQVLLNLLSNAIKFTEQGAIEVRASTSDCEDGAVDLQIEVRDSGIGMSDEVRKRVFDPFVQADTSISRKYGGTGLGLAICRKLCVMMGGSIGVESKEGQGSRFWFKVRCELGAMPLAPPPLEPNAADRKLEVLVAEDSPIIATLISSLLVKQGLQATVVGNGTKAVRAVSERPFDVVLMDVQMPEMDGISATRAIRQLPGPERDVPIIALTANALVGQREAYLAAGMNEYVTKPIQPPTLFAAIRRWARPHTAAPPLQPQQGGPIEPTNATVAQAATLVD